MELEDGTLVKGNGDVFYICLLANPIRHVECAVIFFTVSITAKSRSLAKHAYQTYFTSSKTEILTFTLMSLTALVRPKAVESPPGPPPMMTTSQSGGLAVIA